MSEHVHLRNPAWTGAARATCWRCGLPVDWRECCNSVAPADHIPGCPAFRKRFPVGSRLGRTFVKVAESEDDGSTWAESE